MPSVDLAWPTYDSLSLSVSPSLYSHSYFLLRDEYAPMSVGLACVVFPS